MRRSPPRRPDRTNPRRNDHEPQDHLRAGRRPEVLQTRDVEVRPRPPRGSHRRQGHRPEPRRVHVAARRLPRAGRLPGWPRLRGGWLGGGRRRRGGRLRRRRQGQPDPVLLDEPVRHLWRSDPGAGLRRGEAAGRTVVHRGGFDMDDVHHGLCRPHRGRARRPWRCGPDHGGLQQRRPGGHPGRQLRRLHLGGAHPHLRQAPAAAGRRRPARHRHRGDRHGVRGDADHRRQGRACRLRPDRWSELRQASLRA